LNLTAVLLLATAVTGLGALAARRPLAQHGPLASTTRSLGTYATALFPVLLAVLLIRSFLFEPYRIPSASMMPTLQDGDFILVNKFAYGLRLPLLHTEVLPLGHPHRGDVVVFRLPSDPSVHFIKRLVGLPGDHVEVHDNQVSINGRLMPQRADGVYKGGFGYAGARLEWESFPREMHVIMLAQQRWATDFSGNVPPGHYFFMGDNRNDSEDSRFPLVGFVPASDLVGPAVLIWMNWRIPGWPDVARIGRVIR